MTLQIVIDAEMAPHLAAALEDYARRRRANGLPAVDGLSAALKWSQVVARGLRLPVERQVLEDARMPSLLLSMPQVAVELGCSKTKVESLIKAGRLKVVDFEGVRRVRRVDLEAYLDGLGGSRSFRDDVEVKGPLPPSGRPAPGPVTSDRHEHDGTIRGEVA